MKAKKSVRGMTLVEIIIALAVFVVTSYILVQVGSTISALTKNANHVNKKVSIEAPIVENGENIIQVEEITATYADGQPVTNSSGVYDKSLSKERLTVFNQEMEPAQGNLRIAMEVDGHEVEIAGKTFTVKKAVEDSPNKDVAKTSYDLQYVYVSKGLKSGSNVFVDPTEPTT